MRTPKPNIAPGESPRAAYINGCYDECNCCGFVTWFPFCSPPARSVPNGTVPAPASPPSVTRSTASASRSRYGSADNVCTGSLHVMMDTWTRTSHLMLGSWHGTEAVFHPLGGQSDKYPLQLVVSKSSGWQIETFHTFQRKKKIFFNDFTRRLHQSVYSWFCLFEVNRPSDTLTDIHTDFT